MPRFNDDELADIPVKTTAPVSTKKEIDLDDEDQTKPAPATKSVATNEDDDLKVGFGDPKLMTKGDGLNRVRAEKDRVARFALLDFVGPFTTKSHFVDIKEKKGTFRCLGKGDDLGYCCQKLDEEGQQHTVALVVHYVNADRKTGAYEKDKNGVMPPIEWELGYVDLSRSNYRSVSTLPPEDSSPVDLDYVMLKKDNGIGYEFVVKSKARWKLNPEMAAEVEAAAQKFIKDGGKKLISKLGRKLSLIEWKALLAGQSASAHEATLEDIESL